MDEITVTTPKQFAAAVQGCAMPTYEAAKQHPVRIVFESCVYTFKAGIHQRRADELVRNIAELYRRKRRA